MQSRALLLMQKEKKEPRNVAANIVFKYKVAT